jgi:hypothetical protein
VFFHIYFMEPFAAISGPACRVSRRKQRNLPLNVNTDGTLDWDHRICDLIEQNRDVLKYFFCATFPGRGAYRLVAGEKPLFKAGFPEI